MTEAMQMTVSSEIAKRMDANNSSTVRMGCEREASPSLMGRSDMNNSKYPNEKRRDHLLYADGPA